MPDQDMTDVPNTPREREAFRKGIEFAARRAKMYGEAMSTPGPCMCGKKHEETSADRAVRLTFERFADRMFKMAARDRVS